MVKILKVDFIVENIDHIDYHQCKRHRDCVILFDQCRSSFYRISGPWCLQEKIPINEVPQSHDHKYHNCNSDYVIIGRSYRSGCKKIIYLDCDSSDLESFSESCDDEISSDSSDEPPFPPGPGPGPGPGPRPPDPGPSHGLLVVSYQGQTYGIKYDYEQEDNPMIFDKVASPADKAFLLLKGFVFSDPTDALLALFRSVPYGAGIDTNFENQIGIWLTVPPGVTVLEGSVYGFDGGYQNCGDGSKYQSGRPKGGNPGDIIWYYKECLKADLQSATLQEPMTDTLILNASNLQYVPITVTLDGTTYNESDFTLQLMGDTWILVFNNVLFIVGGEEVSLENYFGPSQTVNVV